MTRKKMPVTGGADTGARQGWYRHGCAVAMAQKTINGAASRAVSARTRLCAPGAGEPVCISEPPNAASSLGSQSKVRAPAGNERVPPHRAALRLHGGSPALNPVCHLPLQLAALRDGRPR